jgi:hypothetical protein
MHDLKVVAFEVRRPWPRWSRLGSRRILYWPPVVTVWHVEPRGRDSGEVCPHYRMEHPEGGASKAVVLHRWRFHVHHWRIQVHALQKFRRWALTRCTWCGGRPVKSDPVNTSLSWGRDPDQRWWRGEIGLYHGDCTSIAVAHRACVCADPITDNDGYGTCARCGLFREWGREPERTERYRELQAIPRGRRDRLVVGEGGERDA